MKAILAVLSICVMSLFAVQNVVADEAALVLQLKDHQFTPTMPTVPANTRVKISIVNHDATPAEFESDDLKVEKVIAGGQTVAVTVGPLKPGAYEFYDDYNEDVSRTHLIAK